MCMFVKKCVKTGRKTVQRHDMITMSLRMVSDRTSSASGPSNADSNLPQSRRLQSNIPAGHTYHLNAIIKPRTSDHRNSVL